MAPIKLWFVLVLVLSTELRFGESIQPHGGYLAWLYNRFRQVFWNQGSTTRQFAVITVEQLNTFPNPNPEDLPLNNPGDWNAAYYADTIPEHTEPVLFERLRGMVLDFLQENNNLPRNIYLFTYNIPCPACTQTIVHFIENVIPNTIREFVLQHPGFNNALEQIRQMTFRIGWNMERGNQEYTLATFEDFRDTNDDANVPNLIMYPRIVLDPGGSCTANSQLRKKRQSPSGYLTTEWQQVPGGLKHVAAGDSGVWGVNKKDDIYYRSGTYALSEHAGDSWTQIAGKLKQIDVGYNNVWGVNKKNDVYKRNGVSKSKPTGTSWTQISGGKFKHVSVSSKGHVWAINTWGDPFWRQGECNTCRQGKTWKQISGKLMQISVGWAGVWGVNRNKDVYYRSGTFGDKYGSGGNWIRVSGGLKYVTSGEGLLWGVNKNDQIYVRYGISDQKPTGFHWIRLDGRLKQIEVSLNSVWGVNSKNQIFGRLATYGFDLRDNSRTWDRISGSAKHVSTGYSGVWVVNKHDQIYYRYGTYASNRNSKGGGDWRKLDGRLTQLDVGKQVVWGVNKNDNIYIREGIGLESPYGSKWSRIDGHLKHVSVSPKGHVWGVNRKNEIFRRVGANNDNPRGSYWRKIGGGLKQISVGKAGVWGVNNKDEIFYRSGTVLGHPTDGSSWKKVSGSLKYISSGDGVVWGVNSKNRIYYRDGISFWNPDGNSWKSFQGSLVQVETYDGNNGVWGVNYKRQIYGHASLKTCAVKTKGGYIKFCSLIFNCTNGSPV